MTMAIKTYRTKLTLHIPYYAWENEQLVKIDITPFKEYLYEQLTEVGLNGWYLTDARGYYKGREFGEELLTIFCNEAEKDDIIDIFQRTYFDMRELIRQEAFAYECDGALVVAEL